MLTHLFEAEEFQMAQGAAAKPDSAPYPSRPSSARLSRIDGPLKTTGRAGQHADYNFPRLVYGVAVGSTIASGTIRNIDTSAAEKMPGVLLVLQHDNVGAPLRMAPGARGGRNSETRGPLEGNTISYLRTSLAWSAPRPSASAGNRCYPRRVRCGERILKSPRRRQRYLAHPTMRRSDTDSRRPARH